MSAPEDDSRHTAIREDVAQLFRAEALEQYQRGETDEAHLLEVEPRWMRYADRIVLALLAAALVIGVAMRGFR
jgi:multisubunit Na+/H+ antiporter MnhC subunit